MDNETAAIALFHVPEYRPLEREARKRIAELTQLLVTSTHPTDQVSISRLQAEIRAWSALIDTERLGAFLGGA